MRRITRTVTSKGRVTIPKQIREQLGIDAAGKVTFVISDSGNVELRTAPYTFRDLRGFFPRSPDAKPRTSMTSSMKPCKLELIGWRQEM